MAVIPLTQLCNSPLNLEEWDFVIILAPANLSLQNTV